jgi:2-succinyl-5-enolpyruvyl-6-hydroxy-3-cyclohexene-1-carboxylate synthase
MIKAGYTSDHKGAAVLVAQLAESGLRDAVISPGSRNAPLNIALEAHPLISTHVVIDERSAAHVALGLALRTGRPAAVVCTSGTAALNHGPAIAEAYHHRIPLISITADRPAAVIEKGHGQTIFQSGIFGNNCLRSFVIDELEMNTASIIVDAKKAYDIASSGGSVHINVPFAEPLYGLALIENLNLIQSINRTAPKFEIPECMVGEDVRVLVVAGSIPFYKRATMKIPFAGVCEKFSGLIGEAVVHSGDLLIAGTDIVNSENRRPVVIITIGTPPLSKSLRNVLTEIGTEHFHVGRNGKGWDSFSTLKGTIDADPYEFLQKLGEVVKQDQNYLEEWGGFAKTVDTTGIEWSDMTAYETVLGKLPENSTVYLSNSTSARYAQLVASAENLQMHSNRGVAGIDGCTSTAVGGAISETSTRVTLVTGDVAFLYDLNGLASVEELPENLRVVVMNNGGGEIFRLIDGPERVGLVEKYFETKPKTSVKAAAEYCGLSYFCATDIESIEKGLEELERIGRPALLEVVTDPHISTAVYKMLLSKKT